MMPTVLQSPRSGCCSAAPSRRRSPAPSAHRDACALVSLVGPQAVVAGGDRHAAGEQEDHQARPCPGREAVGQAVPGHRDQRGERRDGEDRHGQPVDRACSSGRGQTRFAYRQGLPGDGGGRVGHDSTGPVPAFRLPGPATGKVISRQYPCLKSDRTRCRPTLVRRAAAPRRFAPRTGHRNPARQVPPGLRMPQNPQPMPHASLASRALAPSPLARRDRRQHAGSSSSGSSPPVPWPPRRASWSAVRRLHRGARRWPAASSGLLTLNVNGQPRRVDVLPQETLAMTLRWLGLTGTKLACDRAECSACTVMIDGVSHYSCSTLTHSVRARRSSRSRACVAQRRAAPGAAGLRRGTRRSAASARRAR